MAYQPINIPRGSSSSGDEPEIEFAPKAEAPEPKTKEIKIEKDSKDDESAIKESLEVDLDSDDDSVSDDETQEQQEQSKAKRKPGRPKGSTNKKRDKRIQQLLEQKKQEEARAAELEAKLEQMEKQMFESTKASTASRKATLEQNLESLQAQLKNAIEEDDAAAIVEIQDKMMKANMEYAAVNYEYQNTPQEYKAPEKQQQKPTASPYAMEWIEDHPEFKKDEEFHAAALGANAKLLKEGYDPESQDFYEELDKRLSRRYPEYFDSADTSSESMVEYRNDDDSSDDDESDDIPQTVAGASRTLSGSTPGSNKSGRKRKNTVILSEEDQILCQKWGIDPVSFAKRKKALEGKGRGDYTNIK